MLRLTWRRPRTSTSSLPTSAQGFSLAPASRTFCTAGSRSPINRAIIAITTSDAISVKPDSDRRRPATDRIHSPLLETHRFLEGGPTTSRTPEQGGATIEAPTRAYQSESVDAAVAAAFLVPGLALGSFVNVVAARVPLRRSIVRPPSACMSCSAPIAWYDNVPLLSYALLRGRCRSCGSGIPLRYPLAELVTALLLAGCVWKFGLSADAAVAALFCAALVTVSATDLEHHIVPNRIVLPAAVDRKSTHLNFSHVKE